MDEHVEAFAVEHEPGHDVLEFRGLEDDVELRDWVRASRLIGEGAGLDCELTDDRVAQPFGDRPLRGFEIDVGVIAFDFSHGVPPIRYRASEALIKVS